MTTSRAGTGQPPFGELVALFLREAPAALHPWVLAHGGTCAAKLTSTNAQGRLEATTPDAMHGFFLAEVEFRTPFLIGELSYGDRDLFINTVVSPFGRPLRHGLWEWADAVGEHTIPPRETQWVTQADRLSEIVRGMVGALAKLGDVIAAAEDTVVARMTAARAKVRAEQDALWREAERNGTVRRADAAFRARDWPRVVELLTSVRDLLSPAEMAMLRYAEAQLR